MLKDKLKAYLSEHSDRYAARYLQKRNADLWCKIVEETNFLPADARPKQRCWHVLNSTHSVPKCPVEGIDLKWWDNRYLSYSSMSAKARCPKSTSNRVEKARARRKIDPESRKAYRDDVWRHTKKSWRLNKHRITNHALRGRDWHLDHKVSISEGYLTGVPADIIGHWRNFEIIPAAENYTKHASSSLSVCELINSIQL